MSRFYVAALTGRSGSGKSFAAAYLRALGVPVIDGDDVAREVVEPGKPCLAQLVRAFSDRILKPDGSLNRRMLGDICFADAKKKKKLDEITHPHIIERMTELFEQLHEEGYRYCLVEAPALVESGLYALCDRTILVRAQDEIMLRRIVERDKLTTEQARSRIDSQIADGELAALADIVLENNGTTEEFCGKLDALKTQLDRWFIQ
ncbi:MAG: dephospho-CoA kinase [Oscillospiraceae bacterium]|nr:dephospho-CoA kinase [Oscillospiraceae bacterium]